MKKEVMIHIRGIHFPADGQGKEPIETAAPGEYYFRGGRHYLRYGEFPDDSGKPVFNYIKISPGEMEVRRQGQVNTRLLFAQGKRSKSMYTTAFGTIPLGIFTRSLKLSQTAESIAVEADYTLETGQGQRIADCSLTVLARERDAGCASEKREK